MPFKVFFGNRSTYTGPGDIVPGATAWGSCARAYTRSYAMARGPLMDIRNAGGTTTTIYCLPSGFVDTATLAAWITANGAASVTKLYDQTGNGNHWTNVTYSSMPTITQNALGTLPCMSGVTASATVLTSPNINISQPITFNAFTRHSSANSTASGILVAQSANVGIGTFASNNSIAYSSVSALTQVAVDDVFHSAIGVFNGTSGAMCTDGFIASNSSLGTTGIVAMPVRFFRDNSARSFTGSITEGDIWPVAFTVAQQQAMDQNQRGVAYGYGLRDDFTPASLSPALWIEPRKGDLYQAITPATPASADTHAVGTCPDWSGNAFTLTATANDTTRPTVNGIGTYPYLSFDGTSDILRRTSSLDLYNSPNGYTVALIMRGVSPGTDTRVIAEGNSADTDPLMVPLQTATPATTSAMYYRNDTGTSVGTSSPSGVTPANTNVFDGSDRIYIVTDNATSNASVSNINTYVDGAVGTTLTFTRNGTLVTTDRFALGALLRITAVSYWSGRIYGLVVFKRVLTTQERADLTTYLGNLAGLTFGTGPITGTINVTEAADGAAITGSVPLDVTGTIGVTEASDTALINAAIIATGTIGVTEASDTALINAAIVATGTLAVTEASDTALINASVIGAGINANLAVTEASDTIAITGDVTGVAGTLATREASDTALINAAIVATGTLSVREITDGVAATGSVAWQAILAVTELPDGVAILANVTGAGILAAWEAPDTAAIIGFGNAFGILAAREASDSVVISSARINQIKNMVAQQSPVPGLIAQQGGAGRSPELIAQYRP